jgi:hypothetical protein
VYIFACFYVHDYLYAKQTNVQVFLFFFRHCLVIMCILYFSNVANFQKKFKKFVKEKY